MTGSRYRYTLPSTIGRPEHWFLTWGLSDDVTFGSSCGFCGQSDQRLTYEVRREDDLHWVCQRCAGRYHFCGMLNGIPLSESDARSHLHGLTERLKQRTCHDLIRGVVTDTGDEHVILETLLYFDRNLQLSPLHAERLFSAMDDLEHRVDRRVFEIQMRSRAHQQEFGDLDVEGQRRVWAALTQLQRRRVAALGFAPRIRSENRSERRRSPAKRQSASPAFSGLLW